MSALAEAAPKFPQDAPALYGGVGPRASRGALARRALREPGRAAARVVALLKGRLYVAYCRLRGRRIRVGRGFSIFGRLSVRGPGAVEIGDNVSIWGRVNAWTYAPEAEIAVGDNVMMSGTRFGCAISIRIERDCILADASIRDTDFHSTRADRRLPGSPIRVAPVVIGRNVWVAAAAIILPGTSVGENSVVGAAAVCMRSFPANKVILGNPAKVAMPIPSLDGEASSSAVHAGAGAVTGVSEDQL